MNHENIIIVMTVQKTVYLPLCDWRLAYGWGSGQVWCWRGTWPPIVAVRTFSEKCPLNIRSRTLFTNMLKRITLSNKHIKTVLCVLCVLQIVCTHSDCNVVLDIDEFTELISSLYNILVTTFPPYACSTHNHNNKPATLTIIWKVFTSTNLKDKQCTFSNQFVYLFI